MKAKRSPRKPTTAANLETRFDAGRKVLDYFDPARAVVLAGATAPDKPSKAPLRGAK